MTGRTESRIPWVADIEAEIPESTLESLKAWISSARPVGHFVGCVLANDLMGAYQRADEWNVVAMPHIVKWLYNVAPSGSWGSEQKMKEWREYIARGETEEVPA